MLPHDESTNRADPGTRDPAAAGAAHWLATLSDGDCSDAERQAFLEWLRSSTRNVEEFLKLSTVAQQLGRRDLWPDDDAQALIAAARANAGVITLDAGRETSNQSSGMLKRRRIWQGAIAASILCAIAVTAVMVDTPLTQLFASDYRTAVGEQRSIALEDGSVVELNSQSQLRTRFTKSLRAVELVSGEAIFRVAKDAQRPFRVRTGVSDIVAVGTAFNVNADASRTIVTVLEGRVRVNDRDQPAAAASGQAGNFELASGEQLIIAKAQPAIHVVLPDTEKVTSWTERRLIFEDTPLAAAAGEFARYSAREIRIDDPQLGARKITGVFDATDPASLVEFLATDDAVEIHEQGEGWIITLKR